MSTSPDIEPEVELDENDRQCRMAMLEETAKDYRPRMFAIHGLPHNPGSPDILGWGLEFPDGEGAIFTEPPDGGPRVSDSAERVRLGMSVIGDVRLTWLDPG